VALELAWVLCRAYGFVAEPGLLLIDHLLSLPSLRTEDWPDLKQALAGLRGELDFANILHHTKCRSCEALACFDDLEFA